MQTGEKEQEKIDELFFDELEEQLIVADVGLKTSNELINKLKQQMKIKKLKFKNEIKSELLNVANDFFKLDAEPFLFEIEKKPVVVLVFGVNGVGKTTTIAKLAHFLKEKGKSVVLAAGDTYRAAAVEQLSIWAQRVGCVLISHGQDCDPASVIFDAIAYSRKREVDYVLCDTAGRLHNNKNLMMQLQKIVRVVKTKVEDSEILSLLVVDSTMGQNSLNQVEEFKKVANLKGVVLTKLDGTAKGGIALAIANEKQVPIKFLGLGEGLSDLQEFDSKSFLSAIFD